MSWAMKPAANTSRTMSSLDQGKPWPRIFTCRFWRQRSKHWAKALLKQSVFCVSKCIFQCCLLEKVMVSHVTKSIVFYTEFPTSHSFLVYCLSVSPGTDYCTPEVPEIRWCPSSPRWSLWKTGLFLQGSSGAEKIQVDDPKIGIMRLKALLDESELNEPVMGEPKIK